MRAAVGRWRVAAGRFIVCWCLVFQALACDGEGLPIDLEHLRDRAEENYFDGRYGDAKRVLKEAEDWLGKPLNRRKLIAVGINPDMLEVVFSGFRAEVLFAAGDVNQAQSALRHAQGTLVNCRKAMAAKGQLPPITLQYEAFLEFIRGDLLQPVPDFGLAEDLAMPAEVRKYFAGKNSNESLAAYGRAEKILGNPRADDGSGFYQRLEGRLLTSLARCKILKIGRPTKDEVTDCESLLDRAEATFAKGAAWQQVINQANFQRLPLAFKTLNAQPGAPGQLLKSKRQFAQTISDWVEIELLRAELTAYQEQAAGAESEEIETAEKGYDAVVGFMKAQFGDEHPSAQRVQLSRARWLIALCDAADMKPETRISCLKDCLSDLKRINTLSSGDMVQAEVLELGATVKMLSTAKGTEFLTAEDAKGLTARAEELKKSLAEHMEK